MLSIRTGDSAKTLKPDSMVSSRKETIMHLLFLTDVDLADVIAGLLTLGLGIFFFFLPPERKRTSPKKKTQTDTL
jgi:hypothetical protein